MLAGQDDSSTSSSACSAPCEVEVQMPKAPFAWEPGDEVLVSAGGLGVVGMLLNSLPLGGQLNASIIPGCY